MRNFRSSPAQRRDHYQELTDKIIAALEAGTAPWRRPSDKAAAGGVTAPVNAATGHRYRGINLFVLGMSPLAFATNDPRWCSYRQAAQRGWQVRKGEKAMPVYFLQADRDRGQNERWRTGDAAHPDPALVLGLSRLPDRRNPRACACGRDEGRASADQGRRDHRSSKRSACSDRRGPSVLQPDFRLHPATSRRSFSQPGTAGRSVFSLGHATGHASRLNRDLSGWFGSESYTKEELRALS